MPKNPSSDSLSSFYLETISSDEPFLRYNGRDMHLSDKLTDVLRVDEAHKKALAKLGIVTVRDLFYHFPARYDSSDWQTSGAMQTGNLAKGQRVTLYGTISKAKASKGWKSKIPMAQATISTASGKVKAVWFHQPYIAKMFPEGAIVKVEGTVSERSGEFYLSNPAISHASVVPEEADSLFAKEEGARGRGQGMVTPYPLPPTPYSSSLFPVYPESRGVTSRWIYYAIKKLIKGGALDSANRQIVDPIPADILKRLNLPSLGTALVWIHAPERKTEADAARKRFAFEEIFFIQLKKQQERHMTDALPTWDIRPTKKNIDGFLSKFPFKPTSAQSKALKDIFADFAGTRAMSRLLEGDVGSGKTFVAAATSFAVVTTRPQGQDFGNLQVALMAPTEILATQHFESFVELYRGLPIQVGLITSSGCRKFPSKLYADKTRTGRGLDANNSSPWTDISRSQLLKWVENGEIPILIGTHALIQKSVKFKHLAYVIIDEQHRFGTNQRKALMRGSTPMIANGRESDANENIAFDPIVYKDLSYAITNVLFTVQNSLGSGHKEVVYQKAVAEEFDARGIKYEREKILPVFYRNKKVGTYQPDFVVDGKIILELKLLPFIGEREKKQAWSYLKGSSYHLALLANMGASKVQTIRIVLQTARTANSRSFASHSCASDSPSAFIPHLLSMTATPIPRTLALTIYGDLDLTLLDVMPPGRKPIITKNVPPSGRTEVYEHMRAELAAGRQAYVICPRIDAPDETDETALQAKSVEEETNRLAREVFPKFSVGMLHGKMTAKKKEAVMKEFAEGSIDILVATSVVEVGVNVPNATTIVIEGAERFGLSQLHQLRGRVLRSTHQAYCFLFTESKAQPTLDRLKALTQAANGFELAEHDLMLRGAGDLSGKKQWGVSDIGMEALKNLKLVEAARAEAKRLVESDAALDSLPELKRALAARGEVHFE